MIKRDIMKAKDLMIGDWVKFEGDIFKVLCIDYVCGIVNLKSKNKAIAKDISCILEPIQITEEFLLKNGFEKANHSPIVKRFRLVISENDDKEDILFMDMQLILNCLVFEYINDDFVVCQTILHDACVHELQHLLRLCNIDLEIQL